MTTHSMGDTLRLALDLGNRTWQVGFAVGGPATPARLRSIPARDLNQLAAEIRVAKARLKLPADAPVVSCYEAGRDGFWVHRALTTRLGVENLVVDSSSIERNARSRVAKSDRLDTAALLAKLGRYVAGEERVWRVVNVPSLADEDRRQRHRELALLTQQRTGQINRIKGLLALHGIVLAGRGLRRLDPAALRDWAGAGLPPEFQARLEREGKRLQSLHQEIRRLLAERRAMLLEPDPLDPVVPIVQRLVRLRGVGEVSAWIYAAEFFAWRRFANRRQVGAAAGLCGVPWRSGQRNQDQGISKAGNRYLRALAVELAWSWLRYQPDSEIAQWYRRRYGAQGSRVRRVGIVAVARKLLVALWRYVETGVLPTGAVLKSG